MEQNFVLCVKEGRKNNELKINRHKTNAAKKKLNASNLRFSLNSSSQHCTRKPP